MPRRKRSASTPTDLTTEAVALAEFAAMALVAAEQIGIKKRPAEGFPLDHAERVVATALPSLPASIKKRLEKQSAAITIAETAGILMSIADAVLVGEPLQRPKLLLIAKKLSECLASNLRSPGLAESQKPTKSGLLFQFRITLLGSEPPIWRRIQVADCTVDKLHQHIQTSMGWANCHLHQFEIRGEKYADPDLWDEEFVLVDSTRILLSDIVPKNGKRFTFQYEYDFGDGWQHEIVFEGHPPADPKMKYPLCVEGERACPPEDCGGVYGYVEFLEAINNRGHGQQETMLDWIGGPFDPEKFDAKAATKAMRTGLPDWRNMR